MEDYNSAQFTTVDKIINSLISREGESGNKLRYKEIAHDVFDDLNLTAIKQTKRVLISVDPRTGGIALPNDFYKFSTISAPDQYGGIHPLVFNSAITDDIVDLGLDADCECGCKDVLCTSTQKYESITEDVEAIMPGGAAKTFTKIIKKNINKDGSVILEVTEPKAIYTGGLHTSTELKSTSSFLCRLEVKECGCVIDNDQNKLLWSTHCSSLAKTCENRTSLLCDMGYPNPLFYPRSLNYNFSNDNKRIIFDSRFPHRKILLRYYAYQSTKDLLVPRIAKKAFMAGIKKEASNYDKLAPRWRILKWENDYNNAVVALRSKISMLMLHEFYEYYFGRNVSRAIYFNNNTSGHFDGYNDYIW
jgi:hypothetical protein